MISRLILMSLVISSTNPCFAFESRFYSSVPMDPLLSQLDETIEKADQKIGCAGLDEIDVGIGEQDEHGISPIYFKRSQVTRFIKAQKSKDLLVLEFYKSLLWLDKQEKGSVLNSFKAFTNSLGYKRVLIVGASATGRYVLYDSDEESKSEKETDKANQH